MHRVTFRAHRDGDGLAGGHFSEDDFRSVQLDGVAC